MPGLSQAIDLNVRSISNQPGFRATLATLFHDGIDQTASRGEIKDDETDRTEIPLGKRTAEMESHSGSLNGPTHTRGKHQVAGEHHHTAVVGLLVSAAHGVTGNFGHQDRFSISAFMNFSPSDARVISSSNILRQILVAAANSGNAKPKASITSQPL